MAAASLPMAALQVTNVDSATPMIWQLMPAGSEITMVEFQILMPGWELCRTL